MFRMRDALAPVCRLEDTLWVCNGRMGKGRGHGQARDKFGLGHLKRKVILCGTGLANHFQLPSEIGR